MSIADRLIAGSFSVEDGDTIRHEGEYKRIKGADTLESHHSGGDAAIYGAEAQLKIADRIIQDAETIKEVGKGYYGRTLVELQDSEGLGIADRLIREAGASPDRDADFISRLARRQFNVEAEKPGTDQFDLIRDYEGAGAANEAAGLQDLLRDQIDEDKFNFGAEDGAIGYSVDQAQRTGGKALEAFGGAFGIESLTKGGKDYADKQDLEIAEGGYKSPYQGSIRDAWADGGFGNALGWMGTRALESSVSSVPPLVGGLVAYFTAPISAPLAAAAVTSGTVYSGVMGAGETKSMMDEKGVDGDGLAVTAGALYGILERFGLGKMFPLDQIVNRSRADIIQEIVKSGRPDVAKAVAKELSKDYAKRIGVEVGVENLQQGVAVGATAIAGGEFTGNEIIDQFLDTTFATIPTAATLSAPATVSQFPFNKGEQGQSAPKPSNERKTLQEALASVDGDESQVRIVVPFNLNGEILEGAEATTEANLDAIQARLDRREDAHDTRVFTLKQYRQIAEQMAKKGLKPIPSVRDTATGASPKDTRSEVIDAHGSLQSAADGGVDSPSNISGIPDEGAHVTGEGELGRGDMQAPQVRSEAEGSESVGGTSETIDGETEGDKRRAGGIWDLSGRDRGDRLAFGKVVRVIGAGEELTLDDKLTLSSLIPLPIDVAIRKIKDRLTHYRDNPQESTYTEEDYNSESAPDTVLENLVKPIKGSVETLNGVWHPDHKKYSPERKDPVDHKVDELNAADAGHIYSKQEVSRTPHEITYRITAEPKTPHGELSTQSGEPLEFHVRRGLKAAIKSGGTAGTNMMMLVQNSQGKMTQRPVNIMEIVKIGMGHEYNLHDSQGREGLDVKTIGWLSQGLGLLQERGLVQFIDNKQFGLEAVKAAIGKLTNNRGKKQIIYRTKGTTITFGAIEKALQQLGKARTERVFDKAVALTKNGTIDMETVSNRDLELLLEYINDPTTQNRYVKAADKAGVDLENIIDAVEAKLDKFDDKGQSIEEMSDSAELVDSNKPRYKTEDGEQITYGGKLKSTTPTGLTELFNQLTIIDRRVINKAFGSAFVNIRTIEGKARFRLEQMLVDFTGVGMPVTLLHTLSGGIVTGQGTTESLGSISYKHRAIILARFQGATLFDAKFRLAHEFGHLLDASVRPLGATQRKKLLKELYEVSERVPEEARTWIEKGLLPANVDLTTGTVTDSQSKKESDDFDGELVAQAHAVYVTLQEHMGEFPAIRSFIEERYEQVRTKYERTDVGGRGSEGRRLHGRGAKESSSNIRSTPKQSTRGPHPVVGSTGDIAEDRASDKLPNSRGGRGLDSGGSRKSEKAVSPSRVKALALAIKRSLQC
ncbi:MAG: hypothetical protein HOE82_11120 [Gammaproteobacteria bacterium]|nr:hypothetical protein [Gammaproteobacteria bacterium]